ncbi:hypothetical protein, partial [Alteromonas stellipolaris]|uniref:hypothetical protein n=1 Tax=Alteromonas stellipolaris TaxID=233316 RepID=UPI001D9B4821
QHCLAITIQLLLIMYKINPQNLFFQPRAQIIIIIEGKTKQNIFHGSLRTQNTDPNINPTKVANT